MKNFAPMKAQSTSITREQIKFPVFGSYKFDGIRATNMNQSMRSTSNTELPSAYVKLHYCQPELEGLDGELIKRGATPGRVYNETNSAVMTKDSMVPVDFYVFDLALESECNLRFEERRHLVNMTVAAERENEPGLILVEQKVLTTWDQVLEYEEQALGLGHEGLMLRSFNGRYKYGRTTLRENNIFKFVRHLMSEAIVRGFYEQLENTNAAQMSGTGHTKRSTAKAGLIGKNTLGGFHCEDVKTGVLFDLGTGVGLDEKARKYIWEHRDLYLNQICRYKHKPYGAKDKPRQPIWDGWVNKMNLAQDMKLPLDSLNPQADFFNGQ